MMKRIFLIFEFIINTSRGESMYSMVVPIRKVQVSL